MAEYNEQATYIFNNFELKRWLHGDENRRRTLLVKLKDDMRKMGLSRRATRAGLVQLAIKPRVILERLSVSCYRKKLLQSSHDKYNFVPNPKERSESNHRDDVEEKRLEDNSQDIVQQFDIQISKAAVGTTLIDTVDANKTCQSKIQECDLSRKESSDGTKPNFNKKVATIVSCIDVTSINYRDILAKNYDIKASPSFSSLEDESLKNTQNFVHESINKSDTTVSIQLKKHSDSSIDPLNDVFRREHNEEKASEIKQEFSPVESGLLDMSQEDSYESKTDNISESNISSSNAIILESKTYSKVKVINFIGKIQNVSVSEKSEKSIEHIDTLLHQTLIKEDVNKEKIYLESKHPQTESQSIETNSKTVIKRKIHSESLVDSGNISLIKIRKVNEVNVSPKKVVADSNIKTSCYEMLSDELVDTVNRRDRESAKYMIRGSSKSMKRGNSKFLKRVRERHWKENNNKIKMMREKFHEYFRGSFDPDTSESEEEREILWDYILRKKKQQSNAMCDPLHNSIREENVEYIFEKNKLTYDLSANKWQKDIESAIPDEIKSDNLHDSTVSVKEYALHDAVTKKQIKDSALLDKCVTLTNKSQKSIENINSDNSCDSNTCAEKFDAVCDATTDEEIVSTCKRIRTSMNDSQKDTENIYSDISCDSSTCTEKFDAMCDATTDEEIASICKRINTSINDSQNDTKSINSDISCDSDACTEKYYSMHNVTTDEKIEEEALVCKRGTSDDNSQENVKKTKKDAVSAKAKFENSNDSSAYKEKYYATIEKDIKDGAACNRDTLTNNSQENIDVPAEVRSDNSSDSSNCTEKYCAVSVIVTKKEIKNKALICTNDTLTNNSQENIENAIPAKAESDSSGNSIARTEKCDITTKKKINDDKSINDESTCMLSDNSQKNVQSAIPLEVIVDNSCNSTVNIGKYAITDEEKGGALIYKHSISNNSQEHIENAIPAEINFDNSCDSILNIKKYFTHNIVTDEKIEDGASIHDTSANNSQENIESAIPVEVQSDNSCDSTVNVEKYDSLHVTAKNEKVKNRASICKSNMSANESELIGNIISTKKQENIQNSSSIDETKNNSKRDISAKHNIPSTIEINLDENMSIENIYFNKSVKKKADTTYKEAEEVSVQATLQNLQKNQEMRNVESIDSAQCKNMQKNATSDLELLITSTHESTSYNVGKKDSCDMLEKNVDNLLLTSSDNIVEDEETIDQLSMITSKFKKNSSEEKSNDSLSISPSNPSSKSNYSDNCSLDSHLTDDDNSEIEVEIKIKPKFKSRVSRKFSLKAPWSAVNTCIKNLHTLKDNPSFLNELLQMDHRTSEKSNCKITNISKKEDDTSLDNNVTIETDEIICDSSPTTKDNQNHSQRRNSQDRLILNEDRNIMACNKKEKDECTQSLIQTTPIITENNLGSSRLACDTSDLGKQLQEVVTNDKQKNNEEQHFRDKIILEGTKNVVERNQDKEVEILSVERKKPQITTENSFESIKAAYDTPDVAEQLPQTSSHMTRKKVRVRSIAELSYQCDAKSVSLNASIPRNVSAFCQSASFQSVSQSATVHSTASQSATVHSTSSQSAPQSTSFQSAPQSAFFQSAPSQSIPFQSVLPQSTCPPLIPPRFTSSQSTSSQSVSKRLPPSYDASVKHTYLSPNASSAVAPVEINTPYNNNLITNLIKTICTNIGHCRSLTQYNHMRLHFPENYIQRLMITVKQISQDIEKLQMWLCTNDTERVLITINFHMPRNQPATISELKSYMQICYDLYYISQQNYANASQYPNISGLLTNASVSNVNAQQFMRNVPFSDTRMPNRDTFMQSSTMPRPAPMTSNINQQQSVRNSVNSTQVPHSRQPRPNIQPYMSYVPPTTHSHMPNANQQQSLENASHSIQGRYMPADMLNVGIQQGFVNMSNISSSNVNMCSYEPVNQGNANVSSTTSTSQLYTALQRNTINSTATASAANNAQQQKQMYRQTSQINSRTIVYPSPMTNQNIPLRIRQTVPGCDKLPNSFTINPDISRTNAVMGNVRHGNTNVNQQQASCNPQASQTSSEKTQVFLPQYNPILRAYLSAPQPAHCNIQMHPVQNTLPDQNMWQIPQQQLAINQGNISMPPTTNTKQSHVLRNTISNITTVKSQFLPKDTSTCPIDLSINDISQNVQQNMSQQKLPVNQGNANMPPTTNTKQSHITSKHPINSIIATSQRVISKDTSTCPINLSIDNTLQNVQENVLNKEAEMPESQNTNRMQKKAQSMNLQDAHQKFLSACNKLQNISTVSENSTQRSSILQNMMFTISPQKNDAVLFLSKNAIDCKDKMQRNEVTLSNNLAILTDIQKILLHDQIKLYFILWDEQKNLLSKQEFERVHNERIMLFYLYWTLDDYIKSMINESQIVKKSVEKSPQDNTLQNKSTLQENTIQTSVDKFTKTQFNQDNENSLECNRIFEKQSEQSIDPNILKSSKSMAVKSNLEASNEELSCTSVIIKEPLSKDTRLQEQDNNTLKKQSQKSSLIDTEKGPQSTGTLSLEEKSITEVSAKNLKTVTQDNAKINESLKEASLYDPFLLKQSLPNLLQDTSIENIKDQSEITKNNTNKRLSNVETESVRENSNIVTLNSSKQTDAISRAQCNTEDQNKKVYNTNNKVSNKNLRNGKRDNVTENIEILNSTKIQFDLLNILQISESSSLNNIQESIFSRKYLGKKCESTEISERHIAYEKHVETTSEFCSSIQQEDPTNERSNDSTETFESFGRLYIDESAETQNQCDKTSFEKDNVNISQDSIELLLDTIRCDSTKVTSFSLLKNTAKADLFDTHQDFKTEVQDIEKLKQSLEIEKMQLQNVSLKFEDECNMRESVIQSINTMKHEDTTEENNELLITEEITFQEVSLKREILKDTLHVEENTIESIYLKHPEDTEKEKIEINSQKLPEDIEEKKIEIDTYSVIEMANKNSEQSLLKIEEIGFQKMSSKFRDPEDTSSIEDNSIGSSYLQLPENIKEETIKIDTQELLEDTEKKKTEMDTHSGIKAINEQLKHVSEQKYGKSRTRALNSSQRDDSLDVNEKEVSAKTDFLDADDIEYISLKSDDSNSTPSILNIRTISPSSFEKMKDIDAFLENNSESLTENDENSLDVNDNLGIPDEIDNRLCLRCKRKSMVYCQACLEAHYCSKRCSSLHWNAEHYKQCKGRDSIICIDE